MGRETDLDDARPPADPEQVGPGIEVLAREECLQLLRRTSVGRLAFVAAGWPIALPVNYSFDGEDLVVRTDPRSQLARATRHAIRVALEIDETRSLYQSGWSVSRRRYVSLSSQTDLPPKYGSLSTSSGFCRNCV